MGTKFAANAVEFILIQVKKFADPITGTSNATSPETATLLGLKVICSGIQQKQKKFK